MSEAFKSQPATISKAEVVSNSDPQKTASLVNGIINLTYFESILQDSIKASIVFGDAVIRWMKNLRWRAYQSLEQRILN